MNISVAILSFTVTSFITKLFLIFILIHFVQLLFPLVYIIITNFHIRSFLNIYTASLSISFFISFLSFNLIALVRISFTILFRIDLLFFSLVYIAVIFLFLSFIASVMISHKLLFHSIKLFFLLLFGYFIRVNL